MGTRVDKARDAIVTVVCQMLGLMGNRQLVSLKADRAIAQMREEDWCLVERAEIRAIMLSIDEAKHIIETGDQRLLASDGPAGNQPPDISLDEWRAMYLQIERAHKLISGINREWFHDHFTKGSGKHSRISRR